MTSETARVLVNGVEVGLLWPARGGGYTLRTGNSLVRAKIHHFSANEGIPGLVRYIEERFGATPEIVGGATSRPGPLP